MSENAEALAKVIRDLRMGRVLNEGLTKRLPGKDWDRDSIQTCPVVDVTSVYNQWMNTGDGAFIYEDHRAAPPWMQALLCYINEAGNIMVIDFSHVEIDDPERFQPWQPINDKYHYGWQPKHVDHSIEWERVKWFITAFVYSGGRLSTGTPVPTAGPLHLWRIPVYPDGEIADVQWNSLHPQFNNETFNNAMMTMLNTLNLCNCVNVVVAEPERHLSRAEQKRMQRLGVKFSEIHIRPVSKSYRGNGTPLADMRPVHGVRGHFATYGGDRGLLFGKLSGRFWIPPHVRGSKEAGEVVQTYVAEP